MLEKNTDWSMVKCENGIVNVVENFIYGSWLYIIKGKRVSCILRRRVLVC